MNKMKLHQFATIVAVVLISAVLTSCGEFMPSDGRFYIKTVRPYGKGIYQYQMISVTGKNSWWLKDSANKYIVGDTITFTPNKQN